MRVMRSAGSVFAVAGLGLCLALPVLAGPAPEPPALRLPSTAEPTGYAVDLTIDPALETFRGVVDIEIRVREKTSLLWLNASDLAIAKVSANAGGRAVGVRAVPGGEDFVGFALERAARAGRRKLHVDYHGKVDDERPRRGSSARRTRPTGTSSPSSSRPTRAARSRASTSRRSRCRGS